MTWRRRGQEVPIFIQFDQYPPHIGEGYVGRIRLVGATAVELTDLREQDEGWYECSFVSLDGGGTGAADGDGGGAASWDHRSGPASAASGGSDEEGVVNGTWIYLAVNGQCSLFMY